MTDPLIDAWRDKAEKDMKGRPLDSLNWHFDDDIVVPPLATRTDTAALAHIQAGRKLRPGGGFAIHELVSAAEPRDAAAALRRAVARGADEIELCLDSLAQDGLDPTPAPEDEDERSIWSAPGDGGVAIHRRADLDAALEGVDLEQTSLWFSAGEAALPILAWWLDRADEQGVARAKLRGGVDIDPYSRLTLRQIRLVDDTLAVSQRCEPSAVWDEVAATVAAISVQAPGIRPLVVDGQVYHLCGASPALELAATLAALIETARELGARGVEFETLADATTLRLQVSHELWPEIAKLRALRLLFAKVAHAFGATEASPRILAVSSGRQRAEDFDQRGNLVRSTLSAFAAITGGCDSLLVTPYDEAGDQSAALDLARDQQLLLRDEGHLARVSDPTAGSHSIEVLTDAIARQAWHLLQQIEEQGGLWATMRDGWLSAQIYQNEQRREADLRMRRRVLVGINRFADLRFGGPIDGDAEQGDDERGNAMVDAFLSWRDGRDQAAAEACTVAMSDSDVESRLDVARGEGHREVSLAELSTANWAPEGQDLEHCFVPVAATDGHEFEDLRAWAQESEDDTKVLLLPIGPVRMARARADFARDLFQVGGLEVVDPGMFASIDEAAAAVEEHQPAVVVLCSDDGEYAELVDALDATVKSAGASLIVAGKVPASAAGAVDHGIRAGLDAARFLQGLQRELGIQPEDDAD